MTTSFCFWKWPCSLPLPISGGWETTPKKWWKPNLLVIKPFFLLISAHNLHTKNLTKTKYQKAYTTKQMNIHNCTIFTSMWSGIHVMSVTTVLWLCSIDDTAQYLRMGDWSKLDSSSNPGFWNLRQHSVGIRILTDMINIWDQLHTVCIFGDFKDQRLLVVSNNDNQYYSY